MKVGLVYVDAARLEAKSGKLGSAHVCATTPGDDRGLSRYHIIVS